MPRHPPTLGGWPDLNYVVRATVGSRQLVRDIRRVVHQIAPDRAVFGMTSLEDVLQAALDQPRLNARVVGAFALLTLILMSVGLYGLLTLLLTERQHELGVRMALGAAPSEVGRLVAKRTAGILVSGTGLGSILTVAGARVVRAELFNVGPLDPIAIGVALATSEPSRASRRSGRLSAPRGPARLKSFE